MTIPNEFRVPVATSDATTAVAYPADRTCARAALILAHGAGAGQQSPFIVNFARAISAHGIDVVTFNFLYIERHRRLPDRAPVLEACYRAVIESVHERVEGARHALFIGGKSMGGRIGTHVAAAPGPQPIAGLVLLGYPLHPPGRPGERRDAHLPSVKRPMLFIQGSRDTFGTPAELSPIVATLDPPPTLHIVEGGDHSFKLSGGSAPSQAAVYAEIQRTIAAWIETISGRSAPEPHRSE